MHHDLEKSVQFYESLGLKKLFYLENQWAEFEIGDIQFGLAYHEESLPERHTGIVLRVDDLSAEYQRLSAAGVRFLKEPTEVPHGVIASFIDPGNNVVDLYEYSAEKLHEAIKQAKTQGTCCSTGDGNCCKK